MRDFDCVQIRTDCESALATMRDELSKIGIVLDISGLVQRVPVIKRKIQTVKDRVRAQCDDKTTSYDVCPVLCLTTKYAA